MTRDQIRNAALELEPPEREALAEELLRSITCTDQDAIDTAGLPETRHRDALERLQGGSTGKDLLAKLLIERAGERARD